MAYTNYGKSPEESKRISWLSIFSSLVGAHPNCSEKEIEQFKVAANNLVDSLFETYKEELPTITVPATPFASKGDGLPLEEFGRCRDCGAQNVKSPKTGKIFCSAKCWLKSK